MTFPRPRSLFAPLLFILLAGCGLNQEAILFHPEKLPPDFRYPFHQPFEEVSLPVPGATINAVMFRAPQPKGVILYLHGNGDLVLRLEELGAWFNRQGYDVLMPDYRGYGKSTGHIRNEEEFYGDMKAAYAWLTPRYGEDRITIYGFSMGTGPAARLAAEFRPRRLLLQAPYSSMVEMMKLYVPWAPTFLLKYPLRTDLQLPKVRCPVYLMHGTADTVIPYDSSQRLYPLVRGEKALLLVKQAGHNDMPRFTEYREFVEKVLAE